MDRCRTDRNRAQRFSDHNSVEEPEYDVVDDQEEVLNVRIFPARPINEEREYADRDLPRSSSAQSLSSMSAGNARIHPRDIHPSAGPAVNRDLKPGRRKKRFENRPVPVLAGDQRPYRCPPSTPTFPSEVKNYELANREEQRGTKKAEFRSQTRGVQTTESLRDSRTSQRHSLDLETHDLEKRSQQNLERVPSRRHHHEWPQTKEDFDQHDFVPKEKPQQTYCEEDWYIGACNRADAEHALHLVNKDGAFLVRDCSVNTNSEPLVLAVYHDKKVYNVKIRFIESTRKYALGTGQRSNDMFESVADIVKFHSIFPIVLISGRTMPGNRYPENCVLTFPVTKRDVEQLLQ